jgi:2-polyprenyl-3-methyl-5-hydroxy-6-metoxy-1,4-benzoquinol methylase
MAAEIAEIIHKRLGPARILEVGPGNGLTAFLLAEQHFDVDTIDNSWEACLYIRKKFKIGAWPGKFEESRFAPTYNFIYAGHVIEHSENPREFFRHAYISLQEGGFFLLETPNTYYAYKHGLAWRHYNTRDAFEHCCLFEMRTIDYVAKATHFDIISKETLPEFQSMQVLLQKPKTE